MNKRLPITAGRLLTLFTGLPLAMLFIGWLAITEVAYVGQGTYQVHLSVPVHGHSIQISLDNGDLHARQGTNNQVMVNGSAIYSLIRSTVIARTTRSGVTVTSRCHFVTWVCTFNFHVAVPTGVAETFSDGSGEIVVTGLINPVVTASNRSGSITLVFAKVPNLVTVDDSFGQVKIILPAGQTIYRVTTEAPFGHISVGVPTSPSSKHVLNITNHTGNIRISN